MIEQRNLILAIVLSVAILFGYQYFVERPVQLARQAQQAAQQQAEPPLPGAIGTAPAPTGAQTPQAPGASPAAPQVLDRHAALAAAPRLPIDAPRVEGSIDLMGGRIDDITFRDYRDTPDPQSPEIVLLSPPGAPEPYFAEFGWVSGDASQPVPDARSRWTANRAALKVGEPVTLSWDNGHGLKFLRTFSVDQDFLFTVAQKVENATNAPVTLYPYSLISRANTPKTAGMYILHEGPLGVFDGTLTEMKYDALKEKGGIEKKSTGGWIGITDKYWLAALVPDRETPVTGHFSHHLDGGIDRYQVDYLGAARIAPANGSVENTARLFAGAKEVKLLDRYTDEYKIDRFDLAIDFGWFYFLTKPIFYVLQTFHTLLGNFGLSILLLTVIIKALFFPLANKSYRAMSKMKKLQPEMKKLQERFGEDRARLNQEMMALYKREKANPVSGCLPMLIQIPVFFSLYKVLFVTIEMRHAPFYGWIHDLSAPDPTTLFNLFGLIPWTPPHFLMIGVWPLIMGITMFLQQKLNPAPADPVQAKMFMFLPLIFTFMLANFPAGLVIYWAWNNVLSISQQKLIMVKMGVH